MIIFFKKSDKYNQMRSVLGGLRTHFVGPRTNKLGLQGRPEFRKKAEAAPNEFTLKANGHLTKTEELLSRAP